MVMTDIFHSVLQILFLPLTERSRLARSHTASCLADSFRLFAILSACICVMQHSGLSDMIHCFSKSGLHLLLHSLLGSFHQGVNDPSFSIIHNSSNRQVITSIRYLASIPTSELGHCAPYSSPTQSLQSTSSTLLDSPTRAAHNLASCKYGR